MSWYNGVWANLTKLAAVAVVVGIPTVLVGMVADNYLEPWFVWTGSKCGVHYGAYTCYGTLPLIVFIAIGVGIAMAYVFNWMKEARQNE